MKVGIVGYTGKMAHSLRVEAKNHDDISISVVYSRKATEHREFLITNSLLDLVRKCDVVLDFSRPETSLEIMHLCSKHRTALVCGTTGFTYDEMVRIKEFSEKTRIFYAANMSLGVAILSHVMQEVIESFIRNNTVPAVSILERHHRHKVDKPSGTAMSLANIIKHHFEITPDIVSLRYGMNVGEHDVIISTDLENFTLKHEATDRRVFAAGAIAAAKFLFKQEANGLYGMNNIVLKKG